MGRLPAAQYCPCGGVGLLDRVARRCCVVILLGGVGTFLLLRDFSCWLAYVQNHKVAFGATREPSGALIGKLNRITHINPVFAFCVAGRFPLLKPNSQF